MIWRISLRSKESNESYDWLKKDEIQGNSIGMR